MKIFIAGLTGTGKSTIANALAQKLKIDYLESSKLFREFANQNTTDSGWWTKSGLKFIHERMQSDFDERFDKYLLNIVDNKEDFIIDSWTMPWLYKEEALRIYLTAPFDIRVERVMLRDNHDLDSARNAVHLKDNETRMIYLQKYQFDINKDLNVFDLVINTQYLEEDDLVNIIANYIILYKDYFS